MIKADDHRFLDKRGLFQVAISIFDDMIRLLKTSPQTSLVTVARMHGLYGSMLRNSDDAQRAYEVFKMELKLVQRAERDGLLADPPKDITRSYIHLANASQQLQNYNEAVQWHEQAAQIREQKMDDPVGLSMAYINYSWCLWKRNHDGDWEKASILLNRVMEMSRGILADAPSSLGANRS